MNLNIIKEALASGEAKYSCECKFSDAPEWLASLIEHYEELSADAIVLHRQVEGMQKTIKAAYNIACEDFESVNQMELIRLTLGESLQSLKGATK